MVHIGVVEGRASVLAVSIGLALTGIAGCAPATPCDLTCSGCCSMSGQCLPGTTVAACGRGGLACEACTAGVTCGAAGRCEASAFGGGGGSATGGGSGTGGGAGGGTHCTTIASIPAADTYYGSHYVAADGGLSSYSAYLQGPDSPGFSYARVERWYLARLGEPVFPQSGVALRPTTYDACYDCLIYHQDCTSPGVPATCSKAFLAQAGTVSYAAGSGNAAAGQFSGSAVDLRYEEWDFENDVKVDGGACVVVAQLGFAATWADGGSATGGALTGGEFPVAMTYATASALDGGAGQSDLGVFWLDRPLSGTACNNYTFVGSYRAISLEFEPTTGGPLLPGTYNIGMTTGLRVLRRDLETSSSPILGSLSAGSVTITRLDTRSIGSFAGTMTLLDGGASPLSGTWDAPICPR